MNNPSESIEIKIAHELLKIGVMSVSKEEPFVWSSGMLSPFYCDNRRTLSYPKVRRMLTEAFCERASKYEFDCVAGVATAGIAHAAWLADCLSLPLIYVRPEAKGHGHQNQIEGHLLNNSRVLMVEDLVASGLSALQAAEAVQQATGSMPVCILAIFTYGLDGVAELFEQKGTLLETLCDFFTFVDVALESGYLDTESYNILLEWRHDHQSWTLKH